MKKLTLALAITFTALSLVLTNAVQAYNFGDFRSEALTSKAWGALNQSDIEGVLAYTNKCLELYEEQAKGMQASLKSFPEGSNDDIFGYWALNDVATSLYVQAEAYRQANMKKEAIATYKRVINEFTYGQSYDTQGWFWKPSEAAKEKLMVLEKGVKIDFGDYTSSFLTTQAWQALNAKKIDEVMIYVDKVMELYGDKARTMQSSLTEYPWESKEKIFGFWALNDVGTALFVKGEALKNSGKEEEAKEVYKTLVDEYYYSQCWDPKGWFWKPAEAAQQALDEIG